MKGFILSPAAIADMDGIWDRTADVWSIAQADRYSAEIKQACMALGNGRIGGRSIREVRAGYFKRSVGSHFIIYRIMDEVIDVVRILHQKMDLPAHLSENGVEH